RDLDVAWCERTQILCLRIRKRKANSVFHALSANQMHELGTPAATDVEHSARAGRMRLFGVEVEFATLRGLEVVRRVRPHRAGVAHRGIQPDLPEGISDVVVVANCARARAQIRLAHPFTPRWSGRAPSGH